VTNPVWKSLDGHLGAALALPIIQIRNLAAFAGAFESTFAKIAIFVTFFPIIVITTSVWLGLWTAALYAVFFLLRSAVP
jgi:hypothetical protein